MTKRERESGKNEFFKRVLVNDCNGKVCDVTIRKCLKLYTELCVTRVN